MKKIILILSIFLLTACSNEEVDTKSSATGKWDSSGSTKATLQFQNKENESGEAQSEIVTTVRPTVLENIQKQFNENYAEKSVGQLKFRVPSNVITTSTETSSANLIRKNGFDFDVIIKILKDEISEKKFIEELQNKDSSLKTIETSTMGVVAVKNLDKGSYSSKIGILMDGKYFIEISSDFMSIPEILVLAELFLQHTTK